MTVRSGSGKAGRGAKARSAARLASVQALYQMDMAATDLNQVIDAFTSGKVPVDDEAGEEMAAADATFFAELLRGVIRRRLLQRQGCRQGRGHRGAGFA